jgi:hypothetical protein
MAHSPEKVKEVLESIKLVGLKDTLKKYKGIIGENTIRRWNDPAWMERERIQALNRYNKHKDDPVFKEKYLESNKKYIQTDKGKLAAEKAHNNYITKNPEKVKETKRQSYLRHKEEHNLRTKLDYEENKDHYKEMHKEYREVPEHKEARNKANKIRYDTDPAYRLSVIIRGRMRTIFKDLGIKKPANTITLCGCTFEQLQEHIEKLFKEGMTWDNHTQFGWHVDHIVPLSKFDQKDPEQVKKAWHYTNLQPLWWKDNLEKYNK